MLKVVHYVNQFFGGVGGESEAELSPRIQEGPVGPGIAIENALGEKGNVIATVICGDNYFAEHIDRASGEVLKLLEPYDPDLFIAGPAFNAGRYGIACGGICKAVGEALIIPALTGMHEENPGLDLFRQDVYIIPTGESIRKMAEVVSEIVRFALRLTSNQKIGSPSEEGYFPRGLLVNELSDQSGAERAVSMLLRKLKGQSYESEVPRPSYDQVAPAPRIADMTKARIALVTDGGLVPAGNPDGIEIKSATRFGRYSFQGKDSLAPDGYEVQHAGYDAVFVRQDPHRLVPVDVMRQLEKEGVIGELYEKFYSTTGVANVVETMNQIGQAMAVDLKKGGVDGVILTST